jgi:hypothetical protein
MSETKERPARHSRHQDNGAGAQQPAVPTAVPVTPWLQYTPEQIAQGEIGTITLDITDGANTVSVTFPRRFPAGFVCQAAHGMILDTHVAAQFRNNMSANAKARSKRYAAATTDAERAENVAWTAEQYVAEYLKDGGYLPNVGSHDGMSVTDRMRHEAAWRGWATVIAEHNASIAKGGPAIIAKAVAPVLDDAGNPVLDGAGKPVMRGTHVTLMSAPAKGKLSLEEYTLLVEQFESKRLAMTTRLLEMPAYADRIQIQLDTLMSAKAARKADKPLEVKVEGGLDLLP